MADVIINDQRRNDSHKIYDITFFEDQIRTVVTHCEIPVDAWISEIKHIHRRRLHRLIVGLDLEWRPSYSRTQNPVATLQLCVGRRCLIFQIIHAETVPQSLIEFFSNENYSFVGVGIHRDLGKLEEFYGLSVNGNVIDLGKLAADKLGRDDLHQAGMKTLVWEVLRKQVEKPRKVTMSRWDSFNLSYAQIKYACIDSYVSFEIGRVLDADH